MLMQMLKKFGSFVVSSIMSLCVLFFLFQSPLQSVFLTTDGTEYFPRVTGITFWGLVVIVFTIAEGAFFTSIYNQE